MNYSSKTVFKRAFNLLNSGEKTKYKIIIILQILMGAIDLLAVASVGILGALSVNGIASKPPGNRVARFLEILNIQNFSFQFQVFFIGSLAAILFIFKSFISIFVTKRIVEYFSFKGARLSSNLISKYLSQNIIDLQKRDNFEALYGMTSGVNSLTLGILATSLAITSDFFLLTIMIIGLLLADIGIAISTGVFFGLIGIILYRSSHLKAHKLGLESNELQIKSNRQILESLNNYREAYVRNSLGYYSGKISILRMNLADVDSKIALLPTLGKYVIESAVIVGALLISASQFLLQDSTHAVATLALFMAAGARIAPAVLRIQQGLILLKSNLGSAQLALSLLEQVNGIDAQLSPPSIPIFKHEGFNPCVIFKNVNFSHVDNVNFKLEDLSFELESGRKLGVIGPSGSGKSTLIDLLLGLLIPDSGSVKISGLNANQAISTWPGSVGYVPQSIFLSNASIRKNILLGFDDTNLNDDDIFAALEIAQLRQFVEDLPFGLDTEIGENGFRLSGGQRQRLGIARALFTKPKLLVLDEATSSLDSQTEFDLTAELENLNGQVTTVVIAHRLSTISNFEKIIYLENGRCLAQGNLEEIRRKIPNFDRQAKIMGL